jgi:peptide/nickel transport system ATP-binding protein
VLAAPRHPYTQLLLSAVPDPKAPPPGAEAFAAASGERGEPPKVIDPSPGCRFRPRCPVAVDTCANVTPQLKLAQAREVACHVAQAEKEVRAFS